MRRRAPKNEPRYSRGRDWDREVDLRFWSRRLERFGGIAGRPRIVLSSSEVGCVDGRGGMNVGEEKGGLGDGEDAVRW
jgi:hypothetical protein